MGADFDASPAARVRPLQRLEISPAVALFVVALPVLFLHAAFQPTVDSTIGSTRVATRLSDVAVVVIGIAAALAAHRDGVAPLRHGRLVWITAGLFLGLGIRCELLPARRQRRVPVEDASRHCGQVRRVRADRARGAARPAHAARRLLRRLVARRGERGGDGGRGPAVLRPRHLPRMAVRRTPARVRRDRRSRHALGRRLRGRARRRRRRAAHAGVARARMGRRSGRRRRARRRGCARCGARHAARGARRVCRRAPLRAGRPAAGAPARRHGAGRARRRDVHAQLGAHELRALRRARPPGERSRRRELLPSLGARLRRAEDLPRPSARRRGLAVRLRRVRLRAGARGRASSLPVAAGAGVPRAGAPVGDPERVRRGARRARCRRRRAVRRMDRGRLLDRDRARFAALARRRRRRSSACSGYASCSAYGTASGSSAAFRSTR